MGAGESDVARDFQGGDGGSKIRSAVCSQGVFQEPKDSEKSNIRSVYFWDRPYATRTK
jgi:hypothetical protein